MIQNLRILGILFIVLTGLGNIALGQEKTITGVVTDASDHLPLPFVNILVKGTSVGTVTDLDGHYSITVTGNEDILVFSYIGYLEQEIPVQQQNTIDLQMKEDVLSLEEVVVIGYGQVQKSDITGSISSISSEEMLERPVTRIDQALQGRAAGVQIASTSGMPGSGTSIRIRGHG
ncbi:MAG: carboxypeptidase-like regulatory domain-containing protein, partial [Candidatus Fermentibacteria bacterium]